MGSSSGGSQLTLASVWESRKMMTSAVAFLAPSSLAVMRPPRVSILTIDTFASLEMYSSSWIFSSGLLLASSTRMTSLSRWSGDLLMTLWKVLRSVVQCSL